MTVKVAETRYGPQIYLAHDVYFAPLIERYGEYNDREVDVFRQMIPEGAVVADVGANIGCHTLALAKIVGKRGRVLAFEPQLPMYYALCGTMALNELWHVSTYCCALGVEPGTAKVSLVDYSRPNNYGGASIVDQHGPEVPVMPLDHFGPQLPTLDFIKIDVEGYETEVLLGARETIRRCRPILYVENDRQEHSDKLITTLMTMEYRVWLHTPTLFNPDNFNGCAEDVFPRVAAIMLLCVPAEREMAIEGLLPLSSPADMIKFGGFPI